MILAQTISNNLIALKPLSEENIPFWTIWDKDNMVQEYLPEPHDTESTDEDNAKYLLDCINDQSEIHASIIDLETDLIIGTISLTDIDEYHKTAELGIVIGNTDYWGRGYGTSAIQLFIEYIQEHTDIVRIVAEFEDENIPLGQVLIKNGFELECKCISSRIKRGERINTVRMVRFLR